MSNYYQQKLDTAISELIKNTNNITMHTLLQQRVQKLKSLVYIEQYYNEISRTKQEKIQQDLQVVEQKRMKVLLLQQAGCKGDGVIDDYYIIYNKFAAVLGERWKQLAEEAYHNAEDKIDDLAQVYLRLGGR